MIRLSNKANKKELEYDQIKQQSKQKRTRI